MTQTTNIKLKKIDGSENWRQIFDYHNDSADKTDSAIAAVQDGLAIVANGDTHAAISEGQFVYVRNHSTLAEGLYKASSAIQTNGGLTTSNLTADGSGGLNNLQEQVTSLNSKLTLTYDTVSSSMTVETGGTAGSVVPSLSASYAKYGNLVHLTYLFWAGAIAGANNDPLILKLPVPASRKTIRYYGHIGYSNAGIPDLYTVISANNATLAQQLAFVHHNATTGAEEAVTGAQISGKNVQGDIWYITE